MPHRNRRLKRAMSVIAAVAAGCLALRSEAARAQQDLANYPERAIRIIVSVPPGAARRYSDAADRAKLQQRLAAGVVENRGGAAGNIGAEAVANAAPDGYTLLATPAGPLVVNAVLYKNLKYDADAYASRHGAQPECPGRPPDLPVNPPKS